MAQQAPGFLIAQIGGRAASIGLRQGSGVFTAARRSENANDTASIFDNIPPETLTGEMAVWVINLLSPRGRCAQGDMSSH